MSNLDLVQGFAPSGLNKPSDPPITPPRVPPMVYISPGSVNTYTNFYGMELTMSLSSTTYIWIDQNANLYMGFNGFPIAGIFPIAIVKTSQYGLVSVIDSRPQGAAFRGAAEGRHLHFVG